MASDAGGQGKPIPKVADFGLAKNLHDQGQTETGLILGTPSYMASEQTTGDLTGRPDRQVVSLPRPNG